MIAGAGFFDKLKRRRIAGALFLCCKSAARPERAGKRFRCAPFVLGPAGRLACEIWHPGDGCMICRQMGDTTHEKTAVCAGKGGLHLAKDFVHITFQKHRAVR